MDKLGSWQSWNNERKRILEKYEHERSSCEKELDEATKSAHKWKDEMEQDWRKRFKPDQYEALAPSLEQNLHSLLEEAERNYLSKISEIEQESRKEIDKHNNSWDPSAVLQWTHDPSPAITPRSPGLTEPSHSRGNSISCSNTATPSSVQGQPSNKEGRMVATINIKKRKEDQDNITKPKRPRIETCSGSGEFALRTPRQTPQSVTKPLTDRTITFDAVYNNPTHKDTIIEYPPGCGNWYILYCQEHQVHFTRHPTQGAAKHVNGQSHGSLAKHHDIAVQELGYRIVDCNQELARQHNQAVDKAYENGYKPINPLMHKSRNKATPTKASPKSASQTSIRHTGKIPTKKGDPREGICDPQPYTVYCATWTDTKDVYPVMILGWDKQNEAGLNMTLADTKLMDISSRPPPCYLYDQGKIITWAPGFEDGGPKVAFREFPVMWFDEKYSWGWVAGRDLREFSSCNPRAKVKKYFKRAHRWIEKLQRSTRSYKGQKASGAIRQGTDQGNLPRSDSDHLSRTKSKRTDSGVRKELGEEASSHPSPIGASDGDLDDPELRRLAEKGGDTSSDEDYESSDPDKHATSDSEDVALHNSHTTYRKSFFSFRSISRSNSATQNVTTKDLDKKKPSETGFATGKLEDSRVDGIARPVPADLHKKQESSRTPLVATNPESTIKKSAVSTLENRGTQRMGLETLDAAIGDGCDANSVRQEKKPANTGNHAEKGATVLTGTNSTEQLLPRQCGSSHDSSQSPKLEKPETPVPQPSSHGSQHHSTSDIPSGPARFEISHYSNGDIEWKKSKAEDPCIQLFYSLDKKSVLSSKGGEIDIKIDTTELSGFIRESDEETQGKAGLKLIYKDATRNPTKLVFDRSEGSNLDTGKKQARIFISWLRDCDIRPAR